MTSMTSTRRVVTVGVHTHSDVHHAAVIDEVGRPVADAGFPTTPAGYRNLLAWAGEHGEVAAFGVEGTGAYGAGLARHLRAAGQTVIEVDLNRPGIDGGFQPPKDGSHGGTEEVPRRAA